MFSECQPEKPGCLRETVDGLVCPKDLTRVKAWQASSGLRHVHLSSDRLTTKIGILMSLEKRAKPMYAHTHIVQMASGRDDAVGACRHNDQENNLSSPARPAWTWHGTEHQPSRHPPRRQPRRPHCQSARQPHSRSHRPRWPIPRGVEVVTDRRGLLLRPMSQGRLFWPCIALAASTSAKAYCAHARGFRGSSASGRAQWPPWCSR